MNPSLKTLQTQAKRGNPNAQSELGLRYIKGQGVGQNHGLGVGWLQQAAHQGNAIAQYHLGLMYAKGMGCAKNYETAGAWFKKAAEQGDANAQYCLGMLYAKGKIFNEALEMPVHSTKPISILANMFRPNLSDPSVLPVDPLPLPKKQPEIPSSLARQEGEQTLTQLLSYMKRPNLNLWMVPVIREMISKNKFIDYCRDTINEKASGAAPDDLFFDIYAMRFYYACKVALEKPGDPTANFKRLDPLFDPALEKVFTPFFMQTVVAWFDAKRKKSSDCDGKAQAWKRRIAEDWMYFD
jgi:hypothetical protein